MQLQSLEKFEEILEPLGNQSAEFFLAASLYYAHKISFERAATLAGLTFEDFKARLNEHFNTGFIIDDEVVLSDITNSETLLRQS